MNKDKFAKTNKNKNAQKENPEKRNVRENQSTPKQSPSRTKDHR